MFPRWGKPRGGWYPQGPRSATTPNVAVVSQRDQATSAVPVDPHRLGFKSGGIINQLIKSTLPTLWRDSTRSWAFAASRRANLAPTTTLTKPCATRANRSLDGRNKPIQCCASDSRQRSSRQPISYPPKAWSLRSSLACRMTAQKSRSGRMGPTQQNHS